MWAGRPARSRARSHLIPLTLPLSWSPSRLMVRVFVLYLFVAKTKIVNSMSLDRLGFDRDNEVLSDNKNYYIDNKSSELADQNMRLEAVPAGGETEMYVLLPDIITSDRDSVEKNFIEKDETTNSASVGGDMIMMESHGSPVLQITNLPPPLPVEKKDKLVQTNNAHSLQSNEDKKIDQKIPTAIEENDNEPIKLVFKNDKDIEDMDARKESDEDVETNDGKDESVEEPESVIDMLADVVDEVEKEIETELVGDDVKDDKIIIAKDKEKIKWETTVEKLEEKSSEKNEEEESIAPLEAVAAIDEIFPEDILEAMALDEEVYNSSEERNKEVQQNKKEIKDLNVQSGIIQSAETKPLEDDDTKKENENIKELTSIEEEENDKKLEKLEEIEKQNVEDEKSSEPSTVINMSNALSENKKEDRTNTNPKDDENSITEAPMENKNQKTNEIALQQTSYEPESTVPMHTGNTGISYESPGTIQGEEEENNKEAKGEKDIEKQSMVSMTEGQSEIFPHDIISNEVNKNEETNATKDVLNELKPIESMTVVQSEAAVEDDESKKVAQISEEIYQNDKNQNTADTDEESINGEEIFNRPLETFNNLQNTEEHESNENSSSSQYTMLTTISQTSSMPTEQQEQEQLQFQNEKPNVTYNEMVPTDNKELNEQTISNMVEKSEMTTESSTSISQIVDSASHDAMVNSVNATTENDTEGLFNSQLRRYDGAQVWRIVVQNDRDRRLADELQTKYDGQLWKEVKQEVDYLLKPQVLAAAENHIRAANLSRIVLIDNLQKVIEVENPPLDELADADNEKGYRLTWHAYHRLADIHEFYEYLAKTYPEICSLELIGYSLERRPLKVLKISNGNAGNPGVWIDGGMHAREWISPASVTYIANQLAEGWEDLPTYMQSVNWYIHAVANPDGYEYTHTTDRLWRKNMRSHGRQCPGVDLNRNFGFKWGGKGTSANPCSQTYRGTKAFSEPETFYISKFISSFPRDTFQAYLSFHSYGQYILYPWGYDYVMTSDRSDLDRVARAAATTITRSSGTKYTVGPSAVTLYPAAGGSDDWAKGIANIKYTYTIEMGDSGRYGFILPASFIETNGKDSFTFIQTVARAISHDVRKRTMKFK